MCSFRSLKVHRLAALTALAMFAVLLPWMAVAAESMPVGPCPLPTAQETDEAPEDNGIRRLRSVVSADASANGVEDDLASLAFVTSKRPVPEIERITQIPAEGRTTLRITVVNNSRHASPDGGVTLSFPRLTRPSDSARIDNVVLPDGMALHVIPAGGELFGRNGLAQEARHLMVEAHGPWSPGQVRTLQLDVLTRQAPVLVHYRSALSDGNGDYRNAPYRSDIRDQQGWPAFACLLGAREGQLVELGSAGPATGGGGQR